MKEVTLSFRKGQGYQPHNRREFIAKNVDPSRTHLNVIYVDESLNAVYHELFDESIKAFNKSERHLARKIKGGGPGYIAKLASSRRQQPWYEIVVQLGDLCDCRCGTPDGETAAKILDQYVRGFQDRNPHLRIIGAYLHMDETTPHVHIDLVPWADDYKVGMKKRAAWDRALQQQGFTGEGMEKGRKATKRAGHTWATPTMQWEEHERGILESIMHEYGWERVRPQAGSRRTHFTIDEYKALLEARKNETEQAADAIDALLNRIQKRSAGDGKTEYILSEDDYAAFRAETIELQAKIANAFQVLDDIARLEKKIRPDRMTSTTCRLTPDGV